MNKKVFLLILSFSLMVFGQANASTNWEKAVGDSVYEHPDQLASFKGGMEAMISYLKSNVHYPEAAFKKGIQGKVLVEFIVRKDGSLTDVKLFKSVHPELDKEALRVVKSMPKWIPGKDKGKYVNVHYVLHIQFKLE